VGCGPDPLKYVGGVRVCFVHLKCHILSFKTVVGNYCKFHIMKDETERLKSIMEGKTNFSRRQFDGLA